MRTAATFARVHGSSKWECISTPSVPIHDQLASIRKLKEKPTHPRFAEVELWTYDQGGHGGVYASFKTEEDLKKRRAARVSVKDDQPE